MSESRMGEKNPNYGKSLSEIHKKRMLEARKTSVSQYNKEEGYIKTFPSYLEASIESGVCIKTIRSHCNSDKIRRSFYRWRKARAVIQYSRIGKLRNKFCSVGEASKMTLIDEGLILECCQGSRKMAGRFIWKYPNTTH